MTHYTHPLAIRIAATLARGSYQQSRLRFSGVWSGADLKGKARRWGDKYEASRWALIRRLQAHPMLTAKVSQYRGGPGNGRRDVTIGLRVASYGLEGMRIIDDSPACDMDTTDVLVQVLAYGECVYG